MLDCVHGKNTRHALGGFLQKLFPWTISLGYSHKERIAFYPMNFQLTTIKINRVLSAKIINVLCTKYTNGSHWTYVTRFINYLLTFGVYITASLIEMGNKLCFCNDCDVAISNYYLCEKNLIFLWNWHFDLFIPGLRWFLAFRHFYQITFL